MQQVDNHYLFYNILQLQKIIIFNSNQHKYLQKRNPTTQLLQKTIMIEGVLVTTMHRNDVEQLTPCY